MKKKIVDILHYPQIALKGNTYSLPLQPNIIKTIFPKDLFDITETKKGNKISNFFHILERPPQLPTSVVLQPNWSSSLTGTWAWTITFYTELLAWAWATSLPNVISSLAPFGSRRVPIIPSPFKRHLVLKVAVEVVMQQLLPRLPWHLQEEVHPTELVLLSPHHDLDYDPQLPREE